MGFRNVEKKGIYNLKNNNTTSIAPEVIEKSNSDFSLRNHLEHQGHQQNEGYMLTNINIPKSGSLFQQNTKNSYDLGRIENPDSFAVKTDIKSPQIYLERKNCDSDLVSSVIESSNDEIMQNDPIYETQSFYKDIEIEHSSTKKTLIFDNSIEIHIDPYVKKKVNFICLLFCLSK